MNAGGFADTQETILNGTPVKSGTPMCVRGSEGFSGRLQDFAVFVYGYLAADE